MEGKWYVNMWRHHTTWFVIFTIAVSSVTWFVMSSATSSMKECHDKIISAYQHRTYTVDSLVSTCTDRNTASSFTPLDVSSFSQSLSRASQSLAKQEADLQTLHLLELEFAKIQNEYEVLNLWCALLTVVFLIFSFFSIFKTNEMSRQGEEALTRLGEITNDASQKSTSIDEKVAEAERRVNEYADSLREDARQSFNDLSTDVSAQAASIDTIRTQISEIRARIQAFPGEIDDARAELENIVRDKEQNIDQYISAHFDSEKREFLTDMRRQVDREISALVDIRERMSQEFDLDGQNANINMAGSEEEEEDSEEDEVADHHNEEG